MSLLKSFGTISFFTLLSRISGFARDIMIAKYLGAGGVMDAWAVAFKLPNFFRRLFAEGAFTAAFVPITSHKIANEGLENAIGFTERALSFMTFSLLIFVLLMEITMPLVMLGLAPGFHKDPAKFELSVYLTRITFPYLLFISLASLCAGLLNSIGRFAAGSATSIILNLSLMAALYFLSNNSNTPAHALSYGIFIAGILQFGWLYIMCWRHGARLRFRMPKLSDDIKRLLKKMVPGIIGAGAVQISLVIDTIIATLVDKAVSFLYYADRLYQFPLSMIGTAMGVALLPMLSRKIGERKHDEAIFTQNRALEMVIFFSLPAAAALFIIPVPIVSVLFERGEFSPSDTVAVAYAIMGFAIGLPAFVMIKIFSAVFFASGDTRTPVKIAITAMALNIAFNFTFIWLFPKLGLMAHVGIATATSLSAWINVILLYIILNKRKMVALDHRIKTRAIRLVAATALMVASLVAAQKFLPELIIKILHAGEVSKLLNLASLIAVGGLVFLISVFLLKAIDMEDIKMFLKRRKQD